MNNSLNVKIYNSLIEAYNTNANKYSTSLDANSDLKFNKTEYEAYIKSIENNTPELIIDIINNNNQNDKLKKYINANHNELSNTIGTLVNNNNIYKKLYYLSNYTFSKLFFISNKSHNDLVNKITTVNNTLNNTLKTVSSLKKLNNKNKLNVVNIKKFKDININDLKLALSRAQQKIENLEKENILLKQKIEIQHDGIREISNILNDHSIHNTNSLINAIKKIDKKKSYNNGKPFNSENPGWWW